METKKALGKAVILVVAIVLFNCDMILAIDFYQDGEIVDGNSFDTVKIYDGVTVEMYGGDVGQIYSWPVSTFNMYGGTVSSLLIGSYAHLYDGNIDTIVHGGEVHIYGYNFVWTLGDQIPQRGILTGYWGNGTSFTINLRDIMPDDPDIILHEIPEPATFLVLGLGSLLIRKKS